MSNNNIENFDNVEGIEIPKTKQETRKTPVKKETRQQRARKRRTRKIALTVLLVATLATTGALVVKPAIEEARENSRVESLLSAYYQNGVVTLPEKVTSKRSYDITYADGETLKNKLIKNNRDIICVRGTYYTPEGVNLARLRFQVTYADYIKATKVNVDGTTVYMAPQGYTLVGEHAYTIVYAEEERIVPVAEDYSDVTIEGAYQYYLAGVEEIIPSLPYSELDNKTLICDVPDGATLDDKNECIGYLELAPKRR